MATFTGNTRIYLFSVNVILWTLLGCEDQSDDMIPIDTTHKPDTLRYYQPFAELSPFYEPIPDDAVVDPNSDVMVQGLVEQANVGFVLSVGEWTVPVYFASDTTEGKTVTFTESWAPRDKLLNVPIPDFAEPDPEEDGHLAIIDEYGGCVYDFFETRYTSEGWKAGWGNVLPLDSDGIFPKGLSARGSGFELLQGVIWPQELRDGYIPHALIFSYDLTRSGGPVSPATESDGASNGNNTIPEGGWVQLNPDLDLSTLSLNAYETTIAKALQEYGMYCADDGGGLQLYAINYISAKNNPYADIWGDEIYIDLSNIPADEFRVLELPPQNPDAEAELVDNECADFQ